MGGFLLTVGTAFGYAAGWTPYAADYTRYLPATVSTARTGLFAAAGLFVSCVVLEVVGAASVTIGRRSRSTTPPRRSPASCRRRWRRRHCWPSRSVPSPPTPSTSIRAQWLSSPSGIKLPHHIARALVTVFFGVAGFLVAWWALPDAAQSYEAFLLIIAYWIGPWLGRGVRRPIPASGPERSTGFLYDRSLRELERPAVVRHRPGGVGAVVLQPGEVRRLGRPRRIRNSVTSRSSSDSCLPARRIWCCADRRSQRSGPPFR